MRTLLHITLSVKSPEIPLDFNGIHLKLPNTVA